MWKIMEVLFTSTGKNIIKTREGDIHLENFETRICSDGVYVNYPDQWSFTYTIKHFKPHSMEGPAIIEGRAEFYFLDGELFRSRALWKEAIAEARALPPELKLTDPKQWVRELK